MQFNITNLIFVILIIIIAVLLFINHKQAEELGRAEKKQADQETKCRNAEKESFRFESLYRDVLHHNNSLADENKQLKVMVWIYQHKDDPLPENEPELEDDELCWPI